MIIWGSCGREIDAGGGVFHCPRCRSEEPYRHIRVARYFTLYFIPLFQTATLGEYVKYESCDGEFKTEALDYEPPTDEEEMLASIQADLRSGTPLQMARRKLVNAGMEEAAADRLVRTAAGKGQRACLNCDLSFVRSIPRCSGCGAEL